MTPQFSELPMRRTMRAKKYALPDWDALYRLGTPPWEGSGPARELIRLLDEGLIKPCRMLEIGCGTGADTVLLARRGFEVTAVENSPTAMERARNRAQRADALIRFVLDDIYSFGRQCGPFELIYDNGFYHYARLAELEKFLDLLWRVTEPGSYYFTLAGAPDTTIHDEFPQVSEESIRLELGRLFHCVQIRPCRLHTLQRPAGYPGWSCLMQRPVIKR